MIRLTPTFAAAFALAAAIARGQTPATNSPPPNFEQKAEKKWSFSASAYTYSLLVGFSWKKVDLTTCIFNPDDSKPTWVVAIGLNF